MSSRSSKISQKIAGILQHPGHSNNRRRSDGHGARRVTPTIPRKASHILWLIAAGALLALYIYDPGAGRGWITCPLHALTGWHCPGCGGQRAVHALLHGRVLEAANYNLLLLLALLGGMVVWADQRFARESLWRVVHRRQSWILVLLVAGVAVFGLLRNLPWAPVAWLAP